MLRAVLLFFVFFLMPMISFAGNVEQQPVYNRVHSGFEIPGTRIGDLLIHPSAKLLETFNDNIYATQNNKRSDFITRIAPGITAQTLNKDRGLKADLNTDHGLYRDNTRENYTDIHMSIIPYLQITHASRLEGKLAFEREHDARTAEAATNNIGAEEPVQWNRSVGRLGWQYKPGRIAFSPFAQYSQNRYENVAAMNGGATFINNDRDRNETEAGFELSCDLTDQNTVYFKTTGFSKDYIRNDFDQATFTPTAISRDSTGHDTRVGSIFQLTPLIHLDANAGYYHQNFDANAFHDVSTMVGKLNASWQVTALTTVDLGAKRDVFETNQMDASSFIQNAVTAKITHELRRNILVGIEATTGTNHYQGSSRKDDFWGAGPVVTYKMNRHIDWQAGYLYDSRSSNQFNADYDRQRFLVGMKVKF